LVEATPAAVTARAAVAAAVLLMALPVPVY
jgi:hypothetical protein